METQTAHSPQRTCEYRVTYWDNHCGAVRYEDFDDEAGANRFAASRCSDDADWSVVDSMPRTAAQQAA